MQREKFSSRLGFILISAGCAIGLGNVWRFPYIAGKYGGAAFILIYLLFLIIFGIPIMTMEFSVGRASGKSIAGSFRALEPRGTRWHVYGRLGMAGNFLLMMYYTTVTGWMFAYFFKMLRGDFGGMTSAQIGAQFDALVARPEILVGCMLLAVVLGFFICSLGLKKGVERITKVMMLALLAIMVVLAVRSVTLPGAQEGLSYYLVPDFSRMVQNGLGDAIFAAMGQAFFTLSIGIGSMAIFGSYIEKDRRLLGESLWITSLDTFVAFAAGLIIIPACFAYHIDPADGPSLIFKTLPNIFSEMPLGQVWGALFFLFMIFAAMSTVVGVFENIISFGMDLRGWSRKKSSLISALAVAVLSLPCALGFNLLSGFQPLGAGTNVLSLEDFLVSNNLLPLGSLIYVLFCSARRRGWGWEPFIEEANTGSGLRFPAGRAMRVYASYVLPLLLLVIWVQGYVAMFFSA